MSGCYLPLEHDVRHRSHTSALAQRDNSRPYSEYEWNESELDHHHHYHNHVIALQSTIVICIVIDGFSHSKWR